MSDDNRGVMLELNKVSLSYRSRKTTFEHGVHRVLDEVSLKLYQGETLGVIGRNGCGKTSMLQLMAAMKGRIGGDQTVVFVSHMGSQIESLCDRAIWIHGGKIKSEGETADVLEDYKSTVKKRKT